MKTIREIIRPRKESEPWNKGKIIGQKPPLLPKHVWAIRTKLQMEKRVRDLALFNLAIDSKLRGCDVVRLHSHMSASERRATELCSSGGKSQEAVPHLPRGTTDGTPTRRT